MKNTLLTSSAENSHSHDLRGKEYPEDGDVITQLMLTHVKMYAYARFWVMSEREIPDGELGNVVEYFK